MFPFVHLKPHSGTFLLDGPPEMETEGYHQQVVVASNICSWEMFSPSDVDAEPKAIFSAGFNQSGRSGSDVSRLDCGQHFVDNTVHNILCILVKGHCCEKATSTQCFLNLR